jgi:hypothetical protein
VLTLSIRRASADHEEDTVPLWRTCGLETSYNDLAQDFRFARAKLNSDILVGVSPEGRMSAASWPDMMGIAAGSITSPQRQTGGCRA